MIQGRERMRKRASPNNCSSQGPLLRDCANKLGRSWSLKISDFQLHGPWLQIRLQGGSRVQVWFINLISSQFSSISSINSAVQQFYLPDAQEIHFFRWYKGLEARNEVRDRWPGLGVVHGAWLNGFPSMAYDNSWLGRSLYRTDHGGLYYVVLHMWGQYVLIILSQI